MRKLLIFMAAACFSGASAADDAVVREVIRNIQKTVSEATRSAVGGAQVAKFRYRADEIYRVAIKPGMFTTFSLPKNEPILQFAVSNPKAVDLSVNQESNTAMLRLLEEESLSAAIVTAKHEYYLIISPAKIGEAWHTGVSWRFDEEEGVDGGFGYRANPQSATAITGQTSDGIEPSSDPMEALRGHPNFDYEYDASHPLAPAAVWDNGRFTWIQINSALQSVPAVFNIGPDGPEVINYVVLPGGRQIKINRLMKQFMLRLGSQSLVVSAKGARDSGRF